MVKKFLGSCVFFWTLCACPAFAVDVGFEDKILHEKPLAELVGENPVACVETYFLCLREQQEENICLQALQKAGSERITAPLLYFKEKCTASGRNEATCSNVMNHIISRNYLLASTIRNLAIGFEHYTDDVFGRGTLWSVFYASQDTVVATLSALIGQSPWTGPSYLRAKSCETQTGKDFQVCLQKENQRLSGELQNAVKKIAVQCIGENVQQCTKMLTDYDRYLAELLKALYVMDSLTHTEPKNSETYIQVTLKDLQLQLLETLLVTHEPPVSIGEGVVLPE